MIAGDRLGPSAKLKETCASVIRSEAKDQFGGLWERRSELILRFAQDYRFRKFREPVAGPATATFRSRGRKAVDGGKKWLRAPAAGTAAATGNGERRGYKKNQRGVAPALVEFESTFGRMDYWTWRPSSLRAAIMSAYSTPAEESWSTWSVNNWLTRLLTIELGLALSLRPPVTLLLL